MDRLGNRILSAAIFSEINFNKGRDIFNYTAEKIASLSNSSSTALDEIPANYDLPVYHVPAMVSFKGNGNSEVVKVPISNILSIVDIKMYGYSVIVFHPQDFMYIDKNGKISSNNALNQTKFQDFTLLAETKLSENIRITKLSK
jgi:hypothetical protein